MHNTRLCQEAERRGCRFGPDPQKTRKAVANTANLFHKLALRQTLTRATRASGRKHALNTRAHASQAMTNLRHGVATGVGPRAQQDQKRKRQTRFFARKYFLKLSSR
jgi:hypothetical protein